MPRVSRVRDRQDEPAGLERSVRHLAVPSRELGDKLIVARPADGAPVVLAATAAVVWRELDEWKAPGEIDRRLAEVFPGVAVHDREAALAEILDALTDDGLLERS